VSRCLLGRNAYSPSPKPGGGKAPAPIFFSYLPLVGRGGGYFCASPHPARRAHRASRHPPLAGRDKRTPIRPAAQMSAKRSINALSLRYMSAKRGMRGTERPRPIFSGQPLGAPQRRYVQAPSPSLPPLPRAAYELPAEMDPGFPTRAGGRRAPEVVRYTGRETRGHSFSDEAAGPLRSSPQAPQPCPLMPGRS
jgi:hypothetical protein